MTIIEFFNPQNSRHLEQYLYYAENGSFEKGVFPENLEYPDLFFKELQSKIIKHHIARHTKPVIGE